MVFCHTIKFSDEIAPIGEAPEKVNAQYMVLVARVGKRYLKVGEFIPVGNEKRSHARFSAALRSGIRESKDKPCSRRSVAPLAGMLDLGEE
ncbi:hypothetical protein [Collinsella intestinalis]|uniref:hypothetical protein n=1 Tax=Collinsella intestinalis TaxID=147207 RepID=UPI00195765DB|nr:hypothetical protein [Collinsella intestinalis]MBM6683253.1 hypothetical protein [Collinsella intestinalis]